MATIHSQIACAPDDSYAEGKKHHSHLYNSRHVTTRHLTKKAKKKQDWEYTSRAPSAKCTRLDKHKDNKHQTPLDVFFCTVIAKSYPHPPMPRTQLSLCCPPSRCSNLPVAKALEGRSSPRTHGFLVPSRPTRGGIGDGGDGGHGGRGGEG